jgi:hypothetical protein
MPWLRQLIDSLSLQRTGFDTMLVVVGFVMDKVAVAAAAAAAVL